MFIRNQRQLSWIKHYQSCDFISTFMIKVDPLHHNNSLLTFFSFFGHARCLAQFKELWWWRIWTHSTKVERDLSELYWWILLQQVSSIILFNLLYGSLLNRVIIKCLIGFSGHTYLKLWSILFQQNCQIICFKVSTFVDTLFSTLSIVRW